MWDALLKYCLSNLFRRSARPGDEESVIERVRKEGNFKCFSEGKNHPTASFAGDVSANEPPTWTSKRLQKGNEVLRASF